MPLSITEVLESFPTELRLSMARLVDALKEELQVTRSDFIELRTVVQELAEAQRRTEQGLEDLRGVVQELAEAQRQTEQAVKTLAETQTK